MQVWKAEHIVPFKQISWFGGCQKFSTLALSGGTILVKVKNAFAKKTVFESRQLNVDLLKSLGYLDILSSQLFILKPICQSHKFSKITFLKGSVYDRSRDSGSLSKYLMP